MCFNSGEKNLETASSHDLWFNDAAFEDFFKKYFLPFVLITDSSLGFTSV
jgi:hypothetical protein